MPRPSVACSATAMLLLASLLAASPAFAVWPSDSTTNVMLTTGPGHETESVLVADGGALTGGKSGAIVAWDDERNGFANHDVYAQRVLADGRIDPAWPAGGLPVCALSGQQVMPAIVQDGNGGAIVVWMDRRPGGDGWYDVYAQHVLANGTLDPAWPPNGLPVCAATQDQQAAQAVSDGAGGAMVVWMDYRSGPWDIYANHVLATGVIDGLWPANGRVVCDATDGQTFPVVVTDGAGGAIVAWNDGRGLGDIYVQRMSLATGLPVWTANGVPLCTLASQQTSACIVADGAGGAVVLWDDNRNSAGTGFDIYAQHVTAAGVADAAWPVNGRAVATETSTQGAPRAIADGSGGVLVVYVDYRISATADLTARHLLGNGTLDPAWPASGVSVCSAVNTQSDQQVVSDGAHGLIACWTDERVNRDIYARRVLANGSVDARWQLNGVAVGAAASNQQMPALLAVDDSDAIAVWSDFRSTVSWKLCAQRISGLGLLGTSAPRIASVRDVANDQGGKLRVFWEPSVADGSPVVPLQEYRLWRRVSFGATTFWEFLAQVPAKGASGYAFMAATATDSVFGSLPWNAFRVTAHLTEGITFFSSALDSGYSVDNLSPWAPQQLAGEYANGTTTLTWGASSEADVAAYRVYRGDAPGFATGPATLVAEVTSRTCADAAGAPRWYGVTAVDLHENEGPATRLAPGAITGAGPPGPPAALSLSPPRPNPVRHAAELELALPSGVRVSCAVYDVGGRLVRALLDASLPAGTHPLAWDTADDRGAPVAGGLYFIRLEVAGVRFVRRLAVLR